jgi:hypothetical protein
MGSSKDSKLTFLGLLLELRNMICDFALIPNEPIELAPICFGTFDFGDHHDKKALMPHSYFGPRPDQPGQHGYFLGASWHSHGYNTEIRPSLMLLRVCKKVNEEAACVFYGQEFRFTSTYGWYLLHDWLKLIRPSNRARLRHLTVAHPAISRLYERQQASYRYERYTNTAEANLALSPLPNNHQLPVLWYLLEYDSKAAQRIKLDEWMFRTRCRTHSKKSST